MSDQVHINPLLLPFSWLYGIIVWFRNKFFDWGILQAVEFPLPVISIGNMAVGGTGKTPHTEYLIRLLRKDYRVAVVSRGYKRKTSGYLLADEHASASTIGDEPYQMWKKFPDVLVAVDTKRVRGIRNLLELPDNKRPEVILLDDAFQHRYVIPSLSIVLTDSNRLLSDDYLLPAGRLREPAGNVSRANMVIVTKCPTDLKPMECRMISNRLDLFPYQSLFFSSFAYGNLYPVFGESNAAERMLADLKDTSVLLPVGIAHPGPFIHTVTSYAKQVDPMVFSDHHAFTSKEIKELKERYKELPGDRKIILTTEKDAVRLVLRDDWEDEWKDVLYYLPVEVVFKGKKTDYFNQKIVDHVRTVKRNRFLDQGTS